MDGWIVAAEALLVPVAIGLLAWVGARLQRSLKEIAKRQEGLETVTQDELQREMNKVLNAVAQVDHSVKMLTESADTRFKDLQTRQSQNNEALHAVQAGFLDLARAWVTGADHKTHAQGGR